MHFYLGFDWLRYKADKQIMEILLMPCTTNTHMYAGAANFTLVAGAGIG